MQFRCAVKEMASKFTFFRGCCHWRGSAKEVTDAKKCCAMMIYVCFQLNEWENEREKNNDEYHYMAIVSTCLLLPAYALNANLREIP